jgi:hypothetical protein
VILQRGEYEGWIRGYLKPRYPELVKPFRALLNSYERIKANDHFDKQCWRSVVSAARSPRIPLSGTATRFLADLTAKHQEACEAVSRMSGDSHWYIRCNALLSLGSETPRNLVFTVVSKGIRDKSARVRALAAHQIQYLHMSELISDLEGQLAIEQHESAKFAIELHVRLLRDGYFLMPWGEKDRFIWVSTDNGMIGRSITLDELDAKGIDTIMEELRGESFG